MAKHKFRVVTYNTHKSRGMDGRVRPQRIRSVLSEVNADLIALQEVLNISGAARDKDQAHYFAEELGLNYCVGQTRMLKGGIYGNVILSRFPVRFTQNYDISVMKYEQRGCLRADIEVAPNTILHMFNLHLGVDYFERRRQGRKIMASEILHNSALTGPRVILGDFNEWTLGIATQFLRKHFHCMDGPNPKRRIKTFPGLLPVLPLDHIYFDPALHLKDCLIHRTRTSLMASDHLPMVADFELAVS